MQDQYQQETNSYPFLHFQLMIRNLDNVARGGIVSILNG